ncbi:Hypothetical protein D9617_17g045950 [Elsinoe fawcettii]|nr:Hypothetical protein D9617_17g045950 [Elsinoe fawcettii]
MVSRPALTGVAATALIPLVARAWDAGTTSPILGDQYATSTLQSLNQDTSQLHLSPADSAGVAVRTLHFDTAARAFLDRVPDATILHLGCGLDSRAQRIKWGPGVSWIDVELPEIVVLRRYLLPVTYPGRTYRLVEADQASTNWLNAIQGGGPALVIMEGLISYMTEEQRTRLFEKLSTKFSAGTMLFDCISSTMLSSGQRARVQALRNTGAEFHSAIDDPRALEEKHPRLKLVQAIPYMTSPQGGW